MNERFDRIKNFLRRHPRMAWRAILRGNDVEDHMPPGWRLGGTKWDILVAVEELLNNHEIPVEAMCR